MKEAILVIVFCVFAVSNGFAQTKQESIKQLFHIMETDSLTEKMISSMFQPRIDQIQLKDSVAQVRFKAETNSMLCKIKSITNRMLNEDMVVLYDKYFSQDEINDFIRFYKSPSGQKLTKLTPDITKELMNIMVQKYLPEITKATTGKIEEKK